MKILMFISRYGPNVATSGPALSVRETVAALAKNHDIAIISRSGLAGGRPKGFPVNQWAAMDGARIFYADKYWRRIDRMSRLLREERPDLVYINSFFDHRSSLLPLTLLRAMRGLDPAIMVAPRGEMSASALSISSRRKGAYRGLAKVFGLHGKVVFHASGDQDFDDITAEFPDAPVGKAQDIGLAPASVPPETAGASNQLRLIFLGRINPMKNIDFALKALALCREPVSFDMIGPVDDPDYRAVCQNVIDTLPANVSARFLDPVPHDRVLHELAGRDLLFMPSRGENFCHAVNESLCVGTPVLISERTNWTPYLGDDLSWALNLADGPQAFAAKIDQLARESIEVRRDRRKRLLTNNPATVVRDKAIRDTRRLFEEVLARHQAA